MGTMKGEAVSREGGLSTWSVSFSSDVLSLSSGGQTEGLFGLRLLLMNVRSIFLHPRADGWGYEEYCNSLLSWSDHFPVNMFPVGMSDIWKAKDWLEWATWTLNTVSFSVAAYRFLVDSSAMELAKLETERWECWMWSPEEPFPLLWLPIHLSKILGDETEEVILYYITPPRLIFPFNEDENSIGHLIDDLCYDPDRKFNSPDPTDLSQKHSHPPWFSAGPSYRHIFMT